jgi:hypothetical protein
LAEPSFTTGIKEVDNLVGGVLPGDNIVWEVDSGAPVDRFVSEFLGADRTPGAIITYISFNRSPQTITRAYGEDMAPGAFRLIDCFSSGKGNNDKVFLDFYESVPERSGRTVVHVSNPSDPAELEKALAGRFAADALAGMVVPATGLTSDPFGSAEYRAHLIGVMARRAVAACG